MRISDWSSDVCSSDLIEPQFHGTAGAGRAHAPGIARHGGCGCYYGSFDRCARTYGECLMKLAFYLLLAGTLLSGAMALATAGRISDDEAVAAVRPGNKIGRAACRERVCR